MAVVRAFIAIELPDDIQQRLQQVSDNLQAEMQELPIRWVGVNSAHLTLKFLGDVSENSVEMISKILETEAAQVKPFDLSVGSLGVFPNMRRPRVIWVGVEAADGLHTLQRHIEAEVARIGYAPEEREFSPHITMGRVSRNTSHRELREIAEVLQKQKLGFIGTGHVEDVHLFRSDLEASGAVYTKLSSAPLLGMDA
ncbi:MAG: RNA 2',3'-cyclic phosphodiesterase [Anaerolineales bacterium]|nr:RNA 2',3'-cyclic phosphodiesterase [Anaerolineales bacterium]